MTPATEHIKQLIIQHLDQGLEDTQVRELQDWMAGNEGNRQAVEAFLNEVALQEGIRAMYHSKDEIWRRLDMAIPDQKAIPFWKKMVAAASIILAIGLGSYLVFFNKASGPKFAPISTDVKAPETNRAMITLADGQTIYLDSIDNGTISRQGNVNIIKTGDGKIIYTGPLAGSGADAVVYNTLHNPRGSKVIDMQLSDGSHVWLNAGSSVRYPIVFVGTQRIVSITGEAYFEITHDVTKPFYVSKGDMKVQVLGTRFNVNAYDDEADIKVTLLEGSVKVSRASSVIRIEPGEQALLRQASDDTAINVIKGVDLDEVMAWRHGKFQFGEKMDIQSIMREIARWYDVTIEYKGEVNGYVGGSVSRNATISTVLGMLEKTGEVKFKIEGRKITVMQ